MKKIGLYIANKLQQKKADLSDKEVFYLFEKIIKDEYGNQGAKNLKPVYLKSGKIFVKSNSSILSNELLLNKKNIIMKINNKIGENTINDIKIN